MKNNREYFLLEWSDHVTKEKGHSLPYISEISENFIRIVLNMAPNTLYQPTEITLVYRLRFFFWTLVYRLQLSLNPRLPSP